MEAGRRSEGSKKYSKTIVFVSWRKENPSDVLRENSELGACGNVEEKVVNELMALAKAVSRRNVES